MEAGQGWAWGTWLGRTEVAVREGNLVSSPEGRRRAVGTWPDRNLVAFFLDRNQHAFWLGPIQEAFCLDRNQVAFCSGPIQEASV